MTTETPTAKPSHSLPLTRGAMYLLEGLLQDPTGCTTPSKMVKWAKLWEMVRKANKRDMLVEGRTFDFEKQMIIDPGESTDAFQRRVALINDAFATWQQEPLLLDFTDKRRDVAREAIKHGIESKKLAMSKSAGGDVNHTLVLLAAFGFAEDDE